MIFYGIVISGKLLSKTNGNELLSNTEQELKKKGLHEFHYRHLGSFAYVGDNKAVFEVPIFGKKHYLILACPSL